MAQTTSAVNYYSISITYLSSLIDKIYCLDYTILLVYSNNQ